jgi:hypothetical protein
MSSNRLPPLSEAEGDGVAAVSPPSEEDLLAEGDGVGSALSPEPESGEEGEPPVSLSALPSEPPGDAEGLGSAVLSFPEDAPSLVEGDGEADVPFSIAATQSLYSSAVRLLGEGDELLLSATASDAVNPMPIRTAVGIAAMAIALPAGMWNLVNSGFFGAA